MRKSIAPITFAVLTVLSAVPAHAMRGDTVNLSAIRQEAAAKGPRIVRIQGALSCEFAKAENTGQGCSLKLVETKTGKSFNLIQASNAMRLFLDGARNVAIEGRMADPETIQVSKAESF